MTRFLICFLGFICCVKIVNAQKPQWYVKRPNGATLDYPLGYSDSTQNKAQFLVTVADFMEPQPPNGAITAVWIFRHPFRSNPVDSVTYYNFSIKLKQYAPDSFTSKRPTAFITGLTTVFYSTIYKLPPAVKDSEWIRFPLQTPFPFSRNTNLIIELSHGPQPQVNQFGLYNYFTSYIAQLVGNVNSASTTAVLWQKSSPYVGLDIVPGAAVSNVVNDDRINLAPNVTHNQSMLYLNMPNASSGEINLTVNNAAGQQVMQQMCRYTEGKLVKEIDLSNAAKGMYFVVITTQYGERMVKRLVLE